MKEKHICKLMKMAMCTALMGMAFTACGDSETDSLDVTESADVTESTDATEATDTTEVTKVALSITAGKQNGSGSEARKDGYDAEDFESGDEIGLYVLSADDLQSAYIDEETCYNVRATYDGSSWTMDNNIFLTNGDAYVIAYYPYDSSIGHTLSTSEDGTLLFDLTPSGSEQTDVLASEGVTVSSSSPQANLWLSHVLTRITLTIDLAYDITISGSLTALSISADELYGDVGLYVDGNGSFQTYSTTKADDLTLSLDDTTVSTDSETTVDFLIPSESSTTLTAELEIENITYEAELTADNEAWNAGYQYTYPITLPDDTSGYTLSDDTSEIVDGYYAVDLGLSVKWASMNVGATSPEEYGNYYDWGELEAIYEDTAQGNDLYGVEIDDIQGNPAYDVATFEWGESWCMPNYDDLDELLNECTWTYTTYNDVNGFLVTSTKFKSIFFPLSGMWDYSSTTTTSQGNTGFYWSSTPLANYPYSSYSFIFTVASHILGMTPRNIGCCVRPVVATTSSEDE